jgi:hypothetical protein
LKKTERRRGMKLDIHDKWRENLRI